MRTFQTYNITLYKHLFQSKADQIRPVSGVDSGTISSIISGVSLSCCHFMGL